jgi:hypothetical protein
LTSRYDGRHHSQIEQPIEPARGDLRLVAFEVAVLHSRLQRLERKPGHGRRRIENRALRFGHADLDLLEPDDGRGLHRLLEFVFVANPGEGASPCRGLRVDGRRLRDGEQDKER